MEESTEESLGGRPVNKPRVSPDHILELGTNPDMGRRELAKQSGIGQDAARTIKKVMNMTIEEFQEAQRVKLQRVADLALSRAEEALPKASALQAATAYGIFSDKINRPGPTSQTLHIHLASGDRSGAIAALLGKHGERVSSRCEPVSTRSDSVSTGPVIELNAPEPGSFLHTGDSQSPAKPRK